MLKFKMKDFSLDIGKRTYVMGILNITPDSFSDGGRYYNLDDAVKHAHYIEDAGADILDIGAQSTRPGHTPVTPEEEIRRFENLLKEIRGNINIPISIDTYYPQAAAAALELGASIINDVSGKINPEMAGIVKQSGAGWILMHNGNPPEDIVRSVHDELVSMAAEAEALGVDSSHICLDPGIGFGKDEYMQNIELVRRTSEVRPDGYAYLVGLSRKRFVGEATGVIIADQRDVGTAVANAAAIMGGADIIRVHNVEYGVQTARMADLLYRCDDGGKNG